MNNDICIYVAGHSGLVGSAVVAKLKASGFTNIITRSHDELDLTRQEQVEEFFAAERPDAVILAAAKVGGIMANSTYKADFIYLNMMIATNVIHAAYSSGTKKLINLGSSCIYPKFAPQPISEDALLTGTLESTNEPYAIAKIAAIKLCRYYNEQYGTDFLSAMPSNLYGPGDNFDLQTSHVLPALIRRFSEAKRTDRPDTDVTLWGDGTPMREFLYVDDLADALVFLFTSIDAELMRQMSADYFVNVGTGTDVTIRELAETVADAVGWNGTVHWDASKPNGTPRKLLDTTKMKSLGWKANTSLRQGIDKTVAWYRGNVT